jgi:hypothetical protein
MVTFPCSGGVSWCTLAYWEERRRVGRLFPVSSPVVEVFQVHSTGKIFFKEILIQDDKKFF